MTILVEQNFYCPLCGELFGDSVGYDYREDPCSCGYDVAYTNRDGILTVSVDLREVPV